MRRREFIAVFGSAAVVMPLSAEAKHKPSVPHIGVLWPVDDHRPLDAFRKALRDLGYVEGDNVVYEQRDSRGKDAVLPDLAADLVRLDVEVILTWGVTAGRIAKQATTTIPIVNGQMSDPVRAKLVDSLARPGGNLTGLTSASPELSAKRLQLIKEIVPNLSRVAALVTTAPTATFILRETEAAAPSLGIRLQVVVVNRPDEFADAYAAMVRERAEALVVINDLMFDQHAPRLIELAAMHRLPAVYYSRGWVDAGGLLSYGVSTPHLFRRAAVYVDKILKGTKPGDLPVEQATGFELVFNMRTAKALGLDLPATVLLRADEVIE
jgi:putative tryptophan/tyrosine transport system substrate-binding protein